MAAPARHRSCNSSSNPPIHNSPRVNSHHQCNNLNRLGLPHSPLVLLHSRPDSPASPPRSVTRRYSLKPPDSPQDSSSRNSLASLAPRPSNLSSSRRKASNHNILDSLRRIRRSSRRQCRRYQLDSRPPPISRTPSKVLLALGRLLRCPRRQGRRFQAFGFLSSRRRTRRGSSSFLSLLLAIARQWRVGFRSPDALHFMACMAVLTGRNR